MPTKLNKILIFFVFVVLFSVVSFIQVKAITPTPISCFENNSSHIHTPKVIVIDFNPNINNNGNVSSLRNYMQTIDSRTFPIGTTGTMEAGCGDPMQIAQDFRSVMNDVSDQMVYYSIVDTLRISDPDKVG